MLRFGLARTLLVAFPLGLWAAACGSAAPATDASEDELNYRSAAGQEFALTASIVFKTPEAVLAASGTDKKAKLKAHADTVETQVAQALSNKFSELWPEAVRLSSRRVALQLRQNTVDRRKLTALNGGARYRMTVRAEFSGTDNIMKELPLQAESGKTYLEIAMDLGEGEKPFRAYVEPIRESVNAYPRYMELLEDGLDIDVYFGDDHHDPRQDINHARSVYADLVRSGFKPPVGKFEELKINSGAFTKFIQVQGRSVPVRVRLVHVDMTTPETRDREVNAFKESVKAADVVVYDGHAGTSLDYSGVVFAYRPSRVAIPAQQFKDLEASNKQQIYFFNGCETYSGYADELLENPRRKSNNTDIITAANYTAMRSEAGQVITFLHALTDPDKNGAWVPRSWDSILSRTEASGSLSWVHVYGVHGIDDNPKLSPLANMPKFGTLCERDTDCIASDSRCVQVTGSKRVCGLACADTSGCPQGTMCRLPRGLTSADDMQCIRGAN